MKLCIFIMTVLFAVTCAFAEKDVMLGKMKNVRSVKLEKPMQPRFVTEVDGNFAAIDRKTNSIILFSPEGKILWSYAKEGKGPGEFSPAIMLSGFYNNRLYVVDNMLNKISFFNYDAKKKSFDFVDEYLVNDGRIAAPMFISPSGKYFIPLNMGKYQIAEMNAQGEVVGNYFPTKEFNPQNASQEDMMKAVQETSYGMTGNDTYVMRANILNNNLQFLKFVGKELKEIKKTKLIHLSKDTYDEENLQSGEQRQLRIAAKGVLTFHFMNNNFYVMGFTPDTAKESVIEMYTPEGEYKGYYLLENSETERIGAVFFRKDGSFIYQKQVLNADKKMVLDDSMLYFATLK